MRLKRHFQKILWKQTHVDSCSIFRSQRYNNGHFKAGVSNSNWSVGHMRVYEVTRGPHYDADATMAVPKLT